LWVIKDGEEVQVTSDAAVDKYNSLILTYSDPKISPDGDKVAFFQNDYTGEDIRTIYIYDISEKDTVSLVLENPASWGSSFLEWSDDSTTLYYTKMFKVFLTS
jgi:Tol biopolymer transport system component